MSVRVEVARLGAEALQRAACAAAPAVPRADQALQPAQRMFAAQAAEEASAAANLASRVRGISGKDVRRAIPVVSLVAAVSVWVQNGYERAALDEERVALEKMRADLEQRS